MMMMMEDQHHDDGSRKLLGEKFPLVVNSCCSPDVPAAARILSNYPRRIFSNSGACQLKT